MRVPPQSIIARAVLLLALITTFPATAADDKLVAVLPFNYTNAKLDKAQQLMMEEDVRSVATNVLAPFGYTVLTSETTLRILQDNGVNVDRACEASCALDAAREMKAHLFISGTIASSEGEHTAYIRIFESEHGRTLSSMRIEGRTPKELRTSLELESRAFFARAGFVEGELVSLSRPSSGEPRTVKGNLLAAAARSQLDDRQTQVQAFQALTKELMSNYFDVELMGEPSADPTAGSKDIASLRLRLKAQPNPAAIQKFLNGLKEISKGNEPQLCLHGVDEYLPVLATDESNSSCFSLFEEALTAWKSERFATSHVLILHSGTGSAMKVPVSLTLDVPRGQRGNTTLLADLFPGQRAFACDAKGATRCVLVNGDDPRYGYLTPNRSIAVYDVIVPDVPLTLLSGVRSVEIVRK